jgi:hypothetical protein
MTTKVKQILPYTTASDVADAVRFCRWTGR